MKRVLVLGGTGIFGGRVARALAQTDGLAVRIAARDRQRGQTFADEIGASFVTFDCRRREAFGAALEDCDLVIHAAGPFQQRDYSVARECIERAVHYIDLADAREFVTGITELDVEARARGVFLGSGASSVPTVTHALVADVVRDLAVVDEISLALSPGNQNPRGSATIAAVLGTLGAPMQVWIDRSWHVRHGWGDTARLEFPPFVGARRVYNCNVPDLDLFPAQFGAATVRFRAGLELSGFNRALSALASLRRARMLPSLELLAPLARRVSLWFFGVGSKNGALAAWVRGRDASGASVERKIALVTADDGPATPSAPSILLARKLLLGSGIPAGARPCMGLLTLGELLAHLEPLGIWCARSTADGRWSAPGASRAS